MAEKQTAADFVVDLFARKAIPGGPSSTAFQRVINALRKVVGEADKTKKKKDKTQAERLFGSE